MKFEFDSAKNKANIAKHGVDMSLAEQFELESALVEIDDRDYGETRYVAIGFLNGVLHVMIFTFRGTTIRVISLRKANTRERRYYDQKETC